jgi:hypothetical protein
MINKYIAVGKKPWLILSLLLLTVFWTYQPGLIGWWMFDDGANIVSNVQLKIETLDFASLRAAFWSGDAGPLGRPLSMLSFAFNHYFTGLDTYYFKLTNLLIHLTNTLLVAWLARKLLASFAASKQYAFHGACLAAAIWGLHPLNLSSVLYIVQRMTSLAALFGLLALALYASWRQSPSVHSITRNVTQGLLVGLCLLASVFCKESGLLFIPLLLWIELLIFKGMRDGHPILLGAIKLMHLIWGICALGLVAIVLMLPAYLDPAAFLPRGFTMEERALTESRILFYYLRLFFAPSLSELSLYHDDFTISSNLFQPMTTLLSVLGLVLVSWVAILFRRKYPLFLFAWGWFLISHALESTVFSLELVHEHRNYFAFVGFAVFIADLPRHFPAPRLHPLFFLIIGAFVAQCAFITWQRAQIWSSPLEHAAFEAEMHPQSSRANYQLGYMYIDILGRTGDKHYIDYIKSAMQQARMAYHPISGPWFASLHLTQYGEPIDNALLQELTQRLREKPFDNANISHLAAFAECQISDTCHVPHHEAVNLFAAAFDNPTSNNIHRAEISKMAARYFVSVSADLEKGEEFLNDALALHEDANGHILLAQTLRLQGKLDQAREQLALAQRVDRKQVWRAAIATESDLIDQAEQKRQSPMEPMEGTSHVE